MSDDSRIDDLRRRLQKDPASIAFAQLAEELRRAGQYQEAVEVCRAGLELHPGYLSARVTLGRAFIDLNRLEDARTELEQVRKVAPENLAAIRALAEIHQRLPRASHDDRRIDRPPTVAATAPVLLRNEPAPPVLPAIPVPVMPPSPVPVVPAALVLEAPPVLTVSTAQAVPAVQAIPVSRQEPVLEPTVSPAREILVPPVEPAGAVREQPFARQAESARALRIIAALEQWLAAIHVARAFRIT
jgi:tetratricopeptide (TPR) repeat protein